MEVVKNNTKINLVSDLRFPREVVNLQLAGLKVNLRLKEI